MKKEEILKGCIVKGTVVKLPKGQLDRKVYIEVKKALEGIGGKWKGGKVAGFVFTVDPTELLSEIANGKKINLKKDYQYFATPDELSDKLVELANIEASDKHFLEPSAGQGNIVKAILRVFTPEDYIDCFELMPQNTIELEKINSVNLIGEDFMKTSLGWKYDKIIANPPFTKGQDILHFRKMYDCLKDTGKVVCILSTSWMSAKTKKPTTFREWLNDANDWAGEWKLFENIGIDTQFERKNGDVVTMEMIPAGAFKTSGTNVKTVILTIDRYSGL